MSSLSASSTLVMKMATILGSLARTGSRADGGPDAAFSLEPVESKSLVEDCKSAWLALEKVNYDLVGYEKGSVVFRRSLYVVENVAAGGELTKANVRSIRPGFGLAPRHLPEVLGRRASGAIKRGEPLAWDMVG